MEIPTEKQILLNWDNGYNKPVVSFLCTSYNQEAYIEETIKGFLCQRLSYPFEIIMHDDNSTDNTKKIIEQYKSQYPNIIKTIFQDQNQYSQGNSPLLIGVDSCISEYIAICEGDDFWINPNKTMNQLKIMLDDTSITMVVSQGKAEENGKIIDKVIGYHGEKVREISAQYILDYAGSLAPTASYLVKKEYLKESLQVFKDAPIGDLFIELYNAVYGKLIYYPEINVIYRRMAKNSWSSKVASNLHSAIEHSEGMRKTIEASKELDGFNELDWTGSRSSNLFNLAINHLYHNDVEGFKKYIILSNRKKRLTGRKLLIFKMKNYGQALHYLLHARKYTLSKYKLFKFGLR